MGQRRKGSAGHARVNEALLRQSIRLDNICLWYLHGDIFEDDYFKTGKNNKNREVHAMSELEGIRGEVHSLCKTIAGIQPLVKEVHGQMPRIAEALESLAAISAKMENNTEDHKRIHYRISDVESSVKALAGRHDELEHNFDSLKEEHIVCITTKQVERRTERASWWTKAKAKAGEKVVEVVTLAVVGFTAWMVLSHLKEYPKTAPVFNNTTIDQRGNSK
jgi:chromosome segregation ATPase